MFSDVNVFSVGRFNAKVTSNLLVIINSEGFQPLGVYKVPEAIYCMIRLIEWLYQDLITSEPTYFQHYSPMARNAEIVRRYRAGESSADLAREFGISDRRVRYLVKRATKNS